MSPIRMPPDRRYVNRTVVTVSETGRTFAQACNMPRMMCPSFSKWVVRLGAFFKLLWMRGALL